METTIKTKCYVCNDEPEVGVACVPGVPVSVAYGQKCLEANAHPWFVLVTNTAIGGGYDNMAPWWKKMVDDTITHLGKTREQFDVDVAETVKSMDAYDA